MKRGMIILGLLIIGSILFQGVVKKSTDSVGQWPYKSVWTDGVFEVREYSKAIMASVEHNGDIDVARNDAFRDLAGYIFGGNDRKEEIAMTAPVVMNESDGGMSMRFVMPIEYDVSELPEPDNKDVLIEEQDGFIAASIAFDGFANERDFEKKADELMAWCKQNAIEIMGEPLYLGYDPPFKLIDRLNEVIVKVESRPVK